MRETRQEIDMYKRESSRIGRGGFVQGISEGQDPLFQSISEFPSFFFLAPRMKEGGRLLKRREDAALWSETSCGEEYWRPSPKTQGSLKRATIGHRGRKLSRGLDKLKKPLESG